LSSPLGSLSADKREAISLVRQSADAIVPRDGSLARVRQLRFTAPGYDPAMLLRMGELGWIGISTPADQGGMGLGMLEYCALTEELGRGLVPEPLVHAAFSAKTLALVDSPLATAALTGNAMVATAWPQDSNWLGARALAANVEYQAPMASASSHIMLPILADNRVYIYVIETASVSGSVRSTQDGGTIVLFEPTDLGPPTGSIPTDAFNRLIDEGALATAGYLLGMIDAALTLALEYLGIRKQFGRLLGSFQVLQHRAVDLHLQRVLSRASLDSAAALYDAGAPARETRAAVSRAKARAADAALLITRQAVQLHGAIGYTDEHDVGLYLRKAMVLNNQFGSANAHRNRYIEDLKGADNA
jgi:alkylation response protein AidB-like acyl-CoA dehydrogenase